jgi:hypothetical protein
MITSREDSNWVSIAEQLSLEMDEAKLAILVKQLCWALDAGHGPPTQDQTKRAIEQIAATIRDSQHKSEFSVAGAVLYKKDPVYCLR